MEDRKKPTKAQIDFLRWLIQKTESDPDWYELERMTRRQVQDVIDRLSVGVDASGWEDEDDGESGRRKQSRSSNRRVL